MTATGRYRPVRTVSDADVTQKVAHLYVHEKTDFEFRANRILKETRICIVNNLFQKKPPALHSFFILNIAVWDKSNLNLNFFKKYNLMKFKSLYYKRNK